MHYAQSYIIGIDKVLNSLNLDGLKKSSVLITGASGLIGSALADVLLRANETLGIGVSLYFAGRNVDTLRKRFSYWGEDSWYAVSYDALLPIDFDFHADYVVHCASNAHPAMYASQPVETIVSNVVGTSNLLSYARDTVSKRVLYISSSEVYGKRDLQKPYVESDNFPVDMLNPRACYPNSKRMCETLCASFFEEYGVESVIARPGHVYGPTATASDSRAHAQFARYAAAGRDIVMKSHGCQLRSYIYGTDCAAALLTVLLKGKGGEAYNVGDPYSACTILDLASAFAEAGNVGIAYHAPTVQESRSYNLMSCSALNCRKLEKLGFRSKVSIKEGAMITLECLKEISNYGS